MNRRVFVILIVLVALVDIAFRNGGSIVPISLIKRTAEDAASNCVCSQNSSTAEGPDTNRPSVARISPSPPSTFVPLPPQTTLPQKRIPQSSTIASAATGLKPESWAVCLCPKELDCALYLYGCRVNTFLKHSLIAPAFNMTNDIPGIVQSCRVSSQVRMASEKEAAEMVREAPIFDLTLPPELIIKNNRQWEHHPFHNVMFPTGALQHYTTQRKLSEYLEERKLPQFVRVTDLPVSTDPPSETFNYTLPIITTKFLEYALTVGSTPGVIRLPSPETTTAAYHSIGLLFCHGLHYFRDGMSTDLIPEHINEFKKFRAMLLNRSLAEYGDVPMNDTHPVLYSPRNVRCDPHHGRTRFMPKREADSVGKLLLQLSNGTEVVRDPFMAPMSEFKAYFHSIRSRKFIYANEGAFFTWMLVSKPETVWTIYYRANYKAHHQYGFFGAFVRVLPDLKLVVFRNTNGVSPPLDELRTAVVEPFAPNVVKFVGADASGNPPNNGKSDPIMANCVDDDEQQR